MYNFGHEVRRLGRSLEQTNYARLKRIMKAGALLPFWSSRPKTEAGQALAGARTSTVSQSRTVDEEQPEDIQAAIDASEDMQLAVQEFGLNSDLYMVLGVSRVSHSLSSAEQLLSRNRSWHWSTRARTMASDTT